MLLIQVFQEVYGDIYHNEVFDMDKNMRNKAYWLIKLFNDCLNETPRNASVYIEINNMVHDALIILKDDRKSYKDGDYALLRLYSRLFHLIGFKTIILSPEEKVCWENLQTFILGEANADLRAVGGPLV